MLLTIQAIILLSIQLHHATSEAIDTHFWLYTKDNLEEYEDMVFDGSQVILTTETRFDPTKPTKLVAHGLGGGIHIDQIFAAAYAKAGMDYNVIGVDWRGMHGPWGTTLKTIGNYRAHFLKAMSNDYALQLADVHCIGFSYGTHVIGKIKTN